MDGTLYGGVRIVESAWVPEYVWRPTRTDDPRNPYPRFGLRPRKVRQRVVYVTPHGVLAAPGIRAELSNLCDHAVLQVMRAMVGVRNLGLCASLLCQQDRGSE